jgi:hypothetical protein
VDADTDGIGFHIPVANDEHGVDFHLFGVRDLGFDVVSAGVELATNLIASLSEKCRGNARECKGEGPTVCSKPL